LKEIDAVNTVSFAFARVLPKRVKQALRFAIKILEPRLFRLFDGLDGVIWLSLNLRYQLKKFFYNLRRNWQLRRMGIKLHIQKKPNLLETQPLCTGVSPKVMTIIPYWEDDSEDFCSGNFFTEIYLSSRDRYGPLNSQKLAGLKAPNWIQQASDEILAFNPTHLILFVEQDPIDTKWWSLDIFLTQLRNFSWEGKIVLVAYDSVWDSTKLHIDRVTKFLNNVTVVTIDRPYLRKNRKGGVSYVGPVILPFSLGTLNALKSMRSLVKSQNLEITFFGRLYGYRKQFLSKLSFEANKKILVNPQGSGVGYRPYLESLGKATSTVDFSRASGKNLKQFKCRVTESALLGCVVITDGADLINRFFPSLIVLGFNNPQNLMQEIFNDETRSRISLEVNTPAYLLQVESMAHNSFWDQVL